MADDDLAMTVAIGAELLPRSHLPVTATSRIREIHTAVMAGPRGQSDTITGMDIAAGPPAGFGDGLDTLFSEGASTGGSATPLQSTDHTLVDGRPSPFLPHPVRGQARAEWFQAAPFLASVQSAVKGQESK